MDNGVYHIMSGKTASQIDTSKKYATIASNLQLLLSTNIITVHHVDWTDKEE